jgi:5-methylcytosine-specific restriction endonuclease McrA
MTPEIKKYLSSSRWQKNRRVRLEHDGWKCQGLSFQGSMPAPCLSEENLVVHHKTYERIRNELLEDMITFCKRCHQQEHRKLRRNKGQGSLL